MPSSRAAPDHLAVEEVDRRLAAALDGHQHRRAQAPELRADGQQQGVLGHQRRRAGRPDAHSSVSATQSRSMVPETFSRRTPRARATATASVMTSSARRRTKRYFSNAPRRSPPMVPSELMAQLIASLLQRAPRRLCVMSTGPMALRTRCSGRRGADRRAPSRLADHEAAGRGALVDVPARASSHPTRRWRRRVRCGADDGAPRAARTGRSGNRPPRRPPPARRQGAARRLLNLRRLRRQEDEIERPGAVGDRHRRARRAPCAAAARRRHRSGRAG